MAGPRLLIVEARFYDDISDQLIKGAVAELTAAGAGYKRIIVPGITEIPATIRFAIRAMELRAIDERYAGYVVLGCAIKGETDHYDHVCRTSMDGLQKLSIDFSLAIGNGIITAPNRDLAMARANPEAKNLGGMAAKACLRMLKVKRELGL